MAYANMTYHAGNAVIDPEMLLAKSGVRVGMHVADFGTGRTGHMIFPAARIVGPKGVLYAVDLDKDVLEAIGRRGRQDAVNNLYPVWGDIQVKNGVLIPPQTLDVVFMVNILWRCQKPFAPLAEAMRLLRPKGRIVIVDWVHTVTAVGPSPDKMLDFGALTAEARRLGLAVQEDFVINEYHRALILYRHE